MELRVNKRRFANLLSQKLKLLYKKTIMSQYIITNPKILTHAPRMRSACDSTTPDHKRSEYDRGNRNQTLQTKPGHREKEPQNTQHNMCETATIKRPKIGFQDQLSVNAGQKHCRMLQGEHSAILSTYIKLPFVIKIFVLSYFE